MINIVGLGFGSVDFLSLGTIRILENSEKIFLNIDNKGIKDYLSSRNLNYKIFNPHSEEEKNKDMAKEIIKTKGKEKNIVFGIIGYPFVFDDEIKYIIELCKDNNVKYKIHNSYNFIDQLMSLLGLNVNEGVNLINYSSLKNKGIDKKFNNIILNLNKDEKIENIKNKLLEFYNEDTEVIVINYLGSEKEAINSLKIKDLSSMGGLNSTTILHLKKDEYNKKDFSDLIELVETLRGENGCPWDMEQDNKSIKNDTLEEVYELIEAINNEDVDNIIEELGDVLFHVVFHASVGKKEKKFNISDVLDRIINKMIFRHPHVFGDGKINTSKDVLVKWEELKKKEKNYNTLGEEMKMVAKTLPALTKASKIQKKAAKVGFDFDNIEEASKKVIEELNEILEVYKTEDKEKIYDEVGDLIFSCVNISRMLKVNEEEALNLTIQKFINRFSFIENEVLKSNRKLNDLTLEEMDSIWEEAKIKERNKN